MKLMFLNAGIEQSNVSIDEVIAMYGNLSKFRYIDLATFRWVAVADSALSPRGRTSYRLTRIHSIADFYR